MKKQTGFTLVEIAIVLVIIGLLLGGVLKGQELITQAKVKNVSNDFNSVGAAVYSYQDRYKSLPGDDKGASTRWASSSPKDGDRNGKIEVIGGGTDETKAFWQHLRLAGLITGDASSDDPPFNAANGQTTVSSANASLSGLVICTSNLSGKMAEAVDSQFDDGKPNIGQMRAAVAGDPTKTVTETAYKDDGASLYTICKNL